MRMTTIKLIIMGSLFLNNKLIYAQEKKDTVKELSINEEIQQELSPIYLKGQLKSMHLWRGIAVTNAIVLDVDAGISTKDGKLKSGVWGGYGANGVYREFDYYVTYAPTKNLTFALWDIYNYSTNATWNNSNFFEYSADKTGHFLDLSVSYTISDKMPLNLYWATVIQGRDRGINNEKNLYSTYVQASYPVIRKKGVDLDLYIGGAFALSPEKDQKSKNFYGPKSGIASLGFVATKTLHLGRYNLPISATTSWSPINKAGNIQLAFDFF